MKLPDYVFKDFLADIRLTEAQRKNAKEGHRRLRERLHEDEALAPIIIASFIQGSYRRATAIKPSEGRRSDVDVVVVTNLSEDDYSNPHDAMKLFEPFLDKYYKGKWERKGRSYGIALSDVDLDLVITSAPPAAQETALKKLAEIDVDDAIDFYDLEAQNSYLLKAEQAQWKQGPLRIPNRDTNQWEDTHPLAQIEWTVNKNRACNTHYVNVVKAIKWWQRLNSDDIERPKGYPLEHLTGDNCLNGIPSIEEGVLAAFQAMETNYQRYAQQGTVPCSRDRGTEENVMKRITPEQFKSFYDGVCKAAQLAKEAYEADDECATMKKWGELFGPAFPPPPESCNEDKKGGFSGREKASKPAGRRFG